MDGYNFLHDVLSTYQSLPDVMKALWLIAPSIFVLGIVALSMWFRLEEKKLDHGFSGTLIYSIYRDEEDQFHIISHIAPASGQPALFLLEPQDGKVKWWTGVGR